MSLWKHQRLQRISVILVIWLWLLQQMHLQDELRFKRVDRGNVRKGSDPSIWYAPVNTEMLLLVSFAVFNAVKSI